MFAWGALKGFRGRDEKCEGKWKNHNHQSGPKETAPRLQYWSSTCPSDLTSGAASVCAAWVYGGKGNRKDCPAFWSGFSLRSKSHGISQWVEMQLSQMFGPLSFTCINTMSSKNSKLWVPVRDHYFVSQSKMERLLDVVLFSQWTQ